MQEQDYSKALYEEMRLLRKTIENQNRPLSLSDLDKADQLKATELKMKGVSLRDVFYELAKADGADPETETDLAFINWLEQDRKKRAAKQQEPFDHSVELDFAGLGAV